MRGVRPRMPPPEGGRFIRAFVVDSFSLGVIIMANTINLLSAEYASAGYLHIVWDRYTYDNSPGFYAELWWTGGNRFFRIYDPKAVSCLMAVECNPNLSYKVKLFALQSETEYDESTGSSWVPVTFS